MLTSINTIDSYVKLFIRQRNFKKENNMPVKKVKGGYKFGSSGKVYKTKAEATKQGRAMYANGYKGKKGK